MAWKVDSEPEVVNRIRSAHRRSGVTRWAKCDGRLVQVGEEMRPPPGLLGDGVLDRGVRVAEEHGAGAEHVIDILVARGIPEARPLAVAHHKADVVRQARCHQAHRRAARGRP